MLDRHQGKEPLGGRVFSRRVALDGIRGAMALLVVFFHLRIPWLSQGYIGVDVFFVLSGFVITSLVIRQQYYQANNHISYLGFYARRCRRLLPASLAVLLSTALIFRYFTSDNYFSTLRGSFMSAALFSENFYLIRQSTDYFARDIATSPVMHYWSLAVEEQYYAIFPIMFGLLMKWTNFGIRSVFWLLAVVVVLVVLQFSLINQVAESILYLSTIYRFYQLLSGVILGIVSFHLGDLSSRFARWRAISAYVGFCGLFVLATSILPMHSTRVGLAATLCAILMIIGLEGNEELWLSRLLCSDLFQFLGRHSYSIYLWHYPVIVFLRFLEIPLAPNQVFPLILVVALILILSWITWKVVELPLKQASASDLKVLMYGVIAVLTTVTVLVLLGPFPSSEESLFVNDLALSSVPVLANSKFKEAEYFIIGDSFADEWTRAAPLIAKAYDISLHVWWSQGCPWFVSVDSDWNGGDCVAVKPWMDFISHFSKPRVLFFVCFSLYDATLIDHNGAYVSHGDPRWSLIVEEALVDVLSTLHADPRNHVVILEDHSPCPTALYECKKRKPVAVCNQTLYHPHFSDTRFEEAHRKLYEVYARVAEKFPLLSFASLDEIIAPNRTVTALDQKGIPVFKDEIHLDSRWMQQHALDLAKALEPHFYEYHEK